MINQVVPNSVQNGAFNNFVQPQNGWYLSTEHLEERKKKNSHKLGITIATSAMVIGFGTMALMKGALPKKAAKYLEKLKTNLEKRIEKGGRFANFYKNSLKAINSFLDKSQSINNITSLKDILFQKFMFSTGFTKGIHTKITEFFNKISRKTVNSSYAKTDKKLASFNEYLFELNKKILARNPKDASLNSAINTINSSISEANKSFNNGFGIQARTNRLSRIDNATKDLFDYMWNASYSDIRNFSSRNMYQTFIAEEKMLPFKKSLSKDVENLKTQFLTDTRKYLAEYKKILSESEYNKLEAKIKEIEKSLDKSIHNETVDYTDKARDLKLGSAPTDVLSILFAIGTVGWFLGKSHDKDERISSSLKYGIPAVGAITTSLLCTAKLISGGKSMAIGLLSGWLMSKAGVVVDDIRKQYKLDVSLENRKIAKS